MMSVYTRRRWGEMESWKSWKCLQSDAGVDLHLIKGVEYVSAGKQEYSVASISGNILCWFGM